MTSRTKATTEEATPQESSASLVVNSIDQYISDGQVFIEEEVITSSTTAPIETQLAPDAWQTHTLGDMDYEIPSSWLVNTDLSSSNTQCFYIGSGTHSSFVSASMREEETFQVFTPEDFDNYLTLYKKQLTDIWTDAQIGEESIHTTGQIYYADWTLDGTYPNTLFDSTIYFRLYIDINTQEASLFILDVIIPGKPFPA